MPAPAPTSDTPVDVPARERVAALFIVPRANPEAPIAPDEVMLRVSAQALGHRGLVIAMATITLAVLLCGMALVWGPRGDARAGYVFLSVAGLVLAVCWALMLRRLRYGPPTACWEGLGDGRCRLSGPSREPRVFRPDELARLWVEYRRFNGIPHSPRLMAQNRAGEKRELLQIAGHSYHFTNVMLVRFAGFLKTMNPSLEFGCNRVPKTTFSRWLQVMRNVKKP